MPGNSWLAEDPLTSQEQLCSVGLVLATNNALLLLNVADFGWRLQNRSETSGALINTSEMDCVITESTVAVQVVVHSALSTQVKVRIYFRRFHKIAKSEL